MNLTTSTTVELRGAHYRITYTNGQPSEVRRVGINRREHPGCPGGQPRRGVVDIERRLALGGPTARAVLRAAERQGRSPAAAYVHVPVAPAVLIDTPDNVAIFGNTGPLTRIVRHGDSPTAELQVRSYGASDHAALTQSLTADQCEARARALLDAAHHLRTHPTPTNQPRTRDTQGAAA
jgi:hypothetical protein